MSNIRNTFRPKIMKSCPPQRHTGPRSRWRDVMGKMKPGNWFELPASMHGAVANAAHLYTRGRYSLYQHPQKQGFYIYVRIK